MMMLLLLSVFSISGPIFLGPLFRDEIPAEIKSAAPPSILPPRLLWILGFGVVHPLGHPTGCTDCRNHDSPKNDICHTYHCHCHSLGWNMPTYQYTLANLSSKSWVRLYILWFFRHLASLFTAPWEIFFIVIYHDRGCLIPLIYGCGLPPRSAASTSA